MTDFNRYVWSFYRWGLDLLFPPSCVSCKRVGTWLCEPCAQQIPLFEAPLCSRCGRPWSKPGLCPVCRKTPLQVNPIRAVFIFAPPIREVLHALKYRGGGAVVTTLAAKMGAAWRQQGMESDLLLPVPLHPSREVKRGYNQATLLALALGKQVDVPVWTRVLMRVRNTPSQTKLNRQERKENMADAFVCAAGLNLAGMRVTLIDDVATTGATLDACAGVLLQAGAAAVNAFTLARAP